MLLRLPLEIRELFEQWLQLHVPDKAEHVMNLIRDTRGGAHYQSEYGVRQRGTGAYADLIGQRFRLATRQAGLGQLARLDVSQFRPPRSAAGQLPLF